MGLGNAESARCNRVTVPHLYTCSKAIPKLALAWSETRRNQEEIPIQQRNHVSISFSRMTIGKPVHPAAAASHWHSLETFKPNWSFHREIEKKKKKGKQSRKGKQFFSLSLSIGIRKKKKENNQDKAYHKDQKLNEK